MELCRSLGLCLVNGRVKGDSLGRYIYTSFHGCSTVDNMITDLDPFSFRAFTVKPLTPLSDHSPITLYLKMTTNTNIHSQPSKLYNIRENYRWAESSKEKYVTENGHPKVCLLLNNFVCRIYTHNRDGVNLAVQNRNYIFEYLANLSNLTFSKKIHKIRQIIIIYFF